MPGSPTHIDLQAVAEEIMQHRGFDPDFPPAVEQELRDLEKHPPEIAVEANIRDLREKLWSSIDNDTSRDLDQIEVAEQLPNNLAKVCIGIADVDAWVARQSAIDQHAARETTSVYAGVRTFPMLPLELSTDSTSLLENQDRLAIIIEFTIDNSGCVVTGDVYRALVRNKAQLQYGSLGTWLASSSTAPAKVASSPDLQAQLRLQDRIAQKMRSQRYRHGALDLDTHESPPLIVNEEVVEIATEQKNNASHLIEDFMIAANGVVARRLETVSSLRRIVRQPKRWDRIVELAAKSGEKLPAEADSKALNDFLLKRKAADPDRFSDLSLAVIKLIGPGEYVLEKPDQPAEGHFGLAVQDYTHSTAPNRRFADMVTQRILKAVLADQPNPYSDTELAAIASNCTEKGDAARKVERDMSKRLAAVAMQNRIGTIFDAIVTGVTPRGTFVRVLQPCVEGLLAQGERGLDVGDKTRVKLIRVDVQQGYIDFARA